MMKRAFTLVEMMFAISIALVLGFLISNFAKNIINFNASSQASMTAQLEGRSILNTMVTELRSTAPSAQGSYAIESASTSSIVFFYDVNGDNATDRIRYFIDTPSRTLKRGLTLASGAPPGYTGSTETFTTLISDISNGSTPMFDYYDKNFTGTSSPLTMPVSISDIRLVKVTAKIEHDPNRSPSVLTVSSLATLRNLRDQ